MSQPLISGSVFSVFPRSINLNAIALRLCLLCSLLVLVPVLATPVQAADATGAAEAVQQVNINTADAETLASALKGVGKQRAQAIVAWRETNGPFTQVEQLLEIKGIGEKVLAKNAANIVLK